MDIWAGFLEEYTASLVLLNQIKNDPLGKAYYRADPFVKMEYNNLSNETEYNQALAKACALHDQNGLKAGKLIKAENLRLTGKTTTFKGTFMAKSGPYKGRYISVLVEESENISKLDTDEFPKPFIVNNGLEKSLLHQMDTCPVHSTIHPGIQEIFSVPPVDGGFAA